MMEASCSFCLNSEQSPPSYLHLSIDFISRCSVWPCVHFLGGSKVTSGVSKVEESVLD